MTFYKCVCDYVIENITTNQIINAAVDSLSHGIECENLCILAGLDENENHFVILDYYNKILNELRIKVPTKKEAANYLAFCYCEELLNKIICPKTFLEKIKDDIYDKLFYLRNKQKYMYMGEDIGIEVFIEIYYLINEMETSDYYKNKNTEDDISKEYEQCYKGAEEYVKKYGGEMGYGRYCI
jgi:hypothetical protein